MYFPNTWHVLLYKPHAERSDLIKTKKKIIQSLKMAEVVDIQKLGVQRKASQAKDEMGLRTKSDSGIPGKKTLTKLPPIRRSAEISPISANTNEPKYKRTTNRKRITVSFVKKSSDVNANEVEEEEHNVHQTQDKMSDSQELCTDRSQDETNGGVNSIKTDNPKECDDSKKEPQNQSYAQEEDGEEDDDEDDDDDRTVSKSSSYSVNYPCFSRESSVTLPYDVASIEVAWLVLSELYPSHVRGRAISVSTVFNWGTNLVVALTFLNLMTHIRGRAISMATVFNWGANLIVALTFLNIMSALNVSGIFFLYGGICLLSLLFIFVFVPETKGRTLEQLSHQLQSRRFIAENVAVCSKCCDKDGDEESLTAGSRTQDYAALQ